jgi:hypothetical protein
MAWTDPRTWTDGELVTASILNAHVRDNFNATMRSLCRNSSDQSVTSSTVLVNATSLSFTVNANEVWQMLWWLRFDAVATNDFKFGWTFPSSEYTLGYTFYDAAGTLASSAATGAAVTLTTAQILQGLGAAILQIVPVSLLLQVGGAGGTVQLQFAQGTSGGTATILKANTNAAGVRIS